jgi:hypothetical protein
MASAAKRLGKKMTSYPEDGVPVIYRYVPQETDKRTVCPRYIWFTTPAHIRLC